MPLRSSARMRGLLLACAFVALNGTLSPLWATSGPNVLFVAIDDLNDWVGVLGGHPQAQTPNLDRLARMGTVFTNAQTASSACNPSRAALLTSVAPSNSGLDTNAGGASFRTYDRLRWAKTLPQHFKEAGYTIKTGGKIFHTNVDLPDSNPQISRGFTDWDSVYNNGDPINPALRLDVGDPRFNPNNIFIHDDRADTILVDYHNTQPGQRHGIQWAKIVGTDPNGRIDESDAAKQRIRDGKADYKVATWAANQIATFERTSTNPLFLSAGIFHPHLTWTVPKQYFDRFPLEDIKLPAVAFDDLEDMSQESQRMAVGIRASENPPRLISRDMEDLYDPNDPELTLWKRAVQGYLAATNFADDAFGKILTALEDRISKNEQMNIDEDWMVVLWSDHGQHLGEKLKWHKFSLWEESAKSPLITWQPGQTPSEVDVPVSLLDIYPTLSEATGLDHLHQLQGTSFKDLLDDPNSRRDGFAITSHARVSYVAYRQGTHAVRSRRFRYIFFGGDQIQEELYDHYTDPHEFHNLLFPGNSSPAEDFDVNAVRNVLGTELYRWVLKTSDVAIPDRYTLDAIPTLGTKYVENFDDESGILNGQTLNGNTWNTVLPGDGNSDFTLINDELLASTGAHMQSLVDNMTLANGENFVVSVKADVNNNASDAGLVFGYTDPNNYLELLIQDGRLTGGQDMRLIQRSNNTVQDLLTFDAADNRDIETGKSTIIADYTAGDELLEIIIADPLGVNFFRDIVQLAQPIPVGSRFGITTHNSIGTIFDEFNLLAYQTTPLPLPDCDFDRDLSCGLSDINLMFAQGDLVTGVAADPNNRFNLDSDNDIDEADISEWLSQSATGRGYSSPFLRGDTNNLESRFDPSDPSTRTVDITDFTNFLTGFTGTGSAWEVGNFNGDGDVDLTDFAKHFLASFAQPYGGDYGTNQAVSEPSTLLLLGLGCLSIAYRRVRRSHVHSRQ